MAILLETAWSWQVQPRLYSYGLILNDEPYPAGSTVQYSCWNHHDVTTDIPMYSVLSIPRECDWRATSYDGRIWADRSTGPDPTLWRAIRPGMGDNIGRPYESGICLGRSDEVGAKHPPSLICPNRSPTSRVSHLSPSVNTLFCLILTVPTFFGEK